MASEVGGLREWKTGSRNGSEGVGEGAIIAVGEVRVKVCVAAECQCVEEDAVKAGERADHWLVGDSGANRRGESVEDEVGDIALRPRPSERPSHLVSGIIVSG